MRPTRPDRGVLSAVTGALAVVFLMTAPALGTQPNMTTGSLHWLNEITGETMQANYDGGPDTGKMEPYLKQLSMVRKNIVSGESADVYKEMNSFLHMLMVKENGISQDTADRIFDLCYEVTPVKFIDKSQYQAKYKKDVAPYMEKFRQDMG